MANLLDNALTAIPKGLRGPLIVEFEELLSSYRAGRRETVGLKAGKLCEIVFTIVSGHISGNYPTTPAKPKNMVTASQAFEQESATKFSRSVRIQIPRLLIAVYELRNNRSMGHVGGDVDPNHMDAELFLRATKWLVAELVRVFGALTVDAAHGLIEGVTERMLPVVWEGNGVKRVLNSKLSAKDKALVLAYSSPKGVSSKDLADWSGYGNLSRFRTSVLKDLDKDALIHFDRQNDVVTILSTGVRRVENARLLSFQ